jgi:hypothetical protein
MILKTITASIALFGLALGVAQAGGPAAQEDKKQAQSSEAAPAPSLDGRRAVRDSVTGKLRAPTEEEAAAMSAASRARAAKAPAVVRQHANGMRSAVLGPEYLSTLQAERSSDGRLVIRHASQGDEHANARRGTTNKTEQ